MATTIAEELQAHLVDLDPQGDAPIGPTRSKIVTATKPHPPSKMPRQRWRPLEPWPRGG